MFKYRFKEHYCKKFCNTIISNKISKLTKSSFIYSIIFFNLIGIGCILSALFNYDHKHISIIGAIFWIIIPIKLFLIINKQYKEEFGVKHLNHGYIYILQF